MGLKVWSCAADDRGMSDDQEHVELERLATISMPVGWTEDQRRRALPSAVMCAVLRLYVGQTTRRLRQEHGCELTSNRL